MASVFLIILEAAFFVISIFATAIAIFLLRRARDALSDDLLKRAITWMIYSSFTLAMISLLVGFNFLVAINSDFAGMLEQYQYVTLTNIAIWVSIACNIMIALLVSQVGKAFGFKDSGSRELFFEKYLKMKK
ncbi:MAG: hypothetical protein ABIG96_01755 [Candidatus Micrarchaeota archaeon]